MKTSVHTGFWFLVIYFEISLITLSILIWDNANLSIGDIPSHINLALLGWLNDAAAEIVSFVNSTENNRSYDDSKDYSKYIVSTLANESDWICFGVNQMVDDWRNGYIDSHNMDQSLKHMWGLFLNMQTGFAMFFADQAYGNSLALYSRSPAPNNSSNVTQQYYAAVTAQSTAVCTFCGSNTSNLYLSGALAADQIIFATHSLGPFDARTQPWYRAALASDGRGVWSDPFPDVLTDQLTIAASRPVRSANGSTLGAVGISLTLDGLRRTLLQARSNLLEALDGGAAPAAPAAADACLLLLDPAGRLLATTTGDAVARLDPAAREPVQANWSSATRSPAARRGLGAVAAFWGGDFAAPFAAAEAFRVYPDPDLVIATRAYAGGFGARMLVVVVLPVRLISGPVGRLSVSVPVPVPVPVLSLSLFLPVLVSLRLSP